MFSGSFGMQVYQVYFYTLSLLTFEVKFVTEQTVLADQLTPTHHRHITCPPFVALSKYTFQSPVTLDSIGYFFMGTIVQCFFV